MLSDHAELDITRADREEPLERRRRTRAPRELSGSSESDQPRELIFWCRPRIQVAPIVQVPGRLYELRHAFVIRIHYRDGRVEATHRALPVSGFGDTLAEALDGFAEMFDVQYRALVEDAQPDELSSGALRFRHEFESHVARTVDHGESAS